MLTGIAILLGLSLAGNVMLFFYTRYLVDKVKFFAENIGELKDVVTNYATHISTILDKHIYGEDPILKKLLQHTSELSGDLKSFMDELEEVKVEYDENKEAERGNRALGNRNNRG